MASEIPNWVLAVLVEVLEHQHDEIAEKEAGMMVVDTTEMKNKGVLLQLQKPTQKAAPYDAELEWIAGNDNRTAYILTDYKPTSNTKAVVVFECVSGSSNGWIFCVQDAHHEGSTPASGKGFGVGWGGGKNGDIVRVVYGYSYVTESTIGGAADAVHELTIDQGVVSLDGAVKADWRAAYIQETGFIALFANNRTSQGIIEKANSKYRLYSLKFYEDDVLTADLVPVRVKQDGYMYDRVSKKLLGNDGTGKFILGPDAK